MGTNSPEYARQYYLAHKEQIRSYQKEYQRKKSIKKRMDINLEDSAFNLSFQGSLKNIEEMYNSLLKKYQDLLEAYNNMKKASTERSQELNELREWKTKIKKFFNL